MNEIATWAKTTMFRKTDDQRAAAEREKIAAYEEAAAASPEAYRRKVIAAAALGYAAPMVFLLLLSGIFVATLIHVLHGGAGGAALAKLALPVLVLIVMVGRSMMIKFDPPEARRIAKKEAPELFNELSSIRKTLKGPKIHEVYIDDNLNAAIEQAPRFGLFGGHVNRLIIGLPLMQTLTVSQFRAVVGHEYGHLAGSHGKTGAWIYRTRAMWRRLYGELEAVEGWLYLPLKVFIHRFSPWFDQLSFPLARANEYEADRAGAAVSDAQTAADALMRVTLSARYLGEKFWPAVRKRSHRSPAPDVAPMAAMAKAFSTMAQWPQRNEWAKEELSVETNFADTHPSLNDRIKALKAKPRIAQPKEVVSTSLLGPLYEIVRKKFDAHWKEETTPKWHAAYAAAKQKRARLAALDKKAKSAGRLSGPDAFERASLAEELLPADAAIARMTDAAKWTPNHAQAWLGLGRLLGQAMDPRALSCLKRASDIDPKLKLEASSIMYQFYSRKGAKDKAETAADAWRTEQERHSAAMDEISSFDKKSDLQGHGLDDDALEPIRDAVKALSEVGEVFLVRKSTDLFAHFFGLHLIIAPKSEKKFDYDAAAFRLQHIQFDEPLFFWFAVQDNRWMRKKAAKIDGAELPLERTSYKLAA
ncbi:MAG: M48 family metallopeptidase [Pseudomonadota bacterium]